MKECQLCKNCYTDDVATCPKDGMPTMHTITGEPVLEGKYQLECRLGQGGMGVVYKARHAFLKTQLAIKIILPDLVGNDPQLVTRFRQEALAAAAIRHQNVVGVTDYGVIAGSIPFLVMEYVDGESLHDLLAREKSLSPERALEMISAIGAGVGAAHHQGIVHRDLKPLNIMICEGKPNLSQAVKILDFGLAKIKSGELLGSFVQAQTTGLMGSPYYMAPEQWADDDVDARSDIYSLGVMLFQMLAGDVPFKGSSIPAIMKKHISDPPSTLASFGVASSPALEAAVAHTLEKDPEKRTASVDLMIEELNEAIHGTSGGIHATAGQLPTSSLTIKTNPPQSKVFIDNVAVGLSRETGLLTLEGIQSGNHNLRVSHTGFHDWVGEVVCDGQPQQVVAELQSGESAGAIPKPGATIAYNARTHDTPANLSSTQSRIEEEGKQTVMQPWQTGDQAVSQASMGAVKSGSGMKPILFGIAGVAGFLILALVGFAGLYLGGFIGGGQTASNGNGVQPTPSAAPSPEGYRAEMVLIPGGSFKMGRNDGDIKERPEHVVEVASFWMDKTEVTNAEYVDYVKVTGATAPSHWVAGKPLAGTELMPVRYVTYNDAVNFAKWRSARDGVHYRLPTEAEWEYAARNGGKNNLYPWGDEWNENNAVMAISDSEPVEVGSKPAGANAWGVVDLIGNVWEWTGSELALYPGNDAVRQDPNTGEKRYVVRGGSAHENPDQLMINSTFRADVPLTQKEKNLGFRLVRPE